MLERAARCLKSSLLTPCNTTTASHSRRSLHSTFWHHGAGDLELAIRTMKALFEPEHISHHGDTAGAFLWAGEAAARDGPYLDFLYPEKTQDLIKRLSRSGLRCWHRHMRSWTSARASRQFMSAARLDQSDEGHEITQAAISAQASSVDGKGPDDAQKDALQRLESLLDTHERGEYRESWREAWDSWSILDSSLRTPSHVHDMMSLLGTSPRSLDTRRVVRLFEVLAPGDRQDSSYLQVILALLKLKEPGKAILVHERGLLSGNRDWPVQGTDILLAHLIGFRQWQLAFYTYRNCMESFGDHIEAASSWSRSMFERLVEMPHLPVRTLSLLRAIAQFPDLSPPEELHYRGFMKDLVGAVIESGRSFGASRNRQVLEILKTLDLTENDHYEKLALRTLDADGVPVKTKKNHALQIYRLYCKEAVFQPSLRLVYTLLKAAIEADDREAVSELLADFYKFHGMPNMQLTGLLLKGLSRRGDIDNVKETLSTFLGRSDQPSLKLFYPLLHVYALHADPTSVQEQLDRMKDKYDVEPDITCWNILLHAFERADDLDGSLSTLSRLREAGMTPDHYTFGTIMAVCADRGDVELCEQLIAMAQSRGVERSSAMNDCYVLALLNNEEAGKARDFAYRSTLNAKPSTTTRMWNQILAHHCVDQRPRNLKQTLSVTRLMQRLKVPFDAMTYSAIMRAYTIKRRTDMARRILHRVILKKDIEVHPFHYAIVIDGYADQLNFEKGLRMHAEMLKLGIKPNLSTQLAMQKLHTLAAEQKFLTDRASHPGLRFDVLDESLEESLQNYDPNHISNKSPELLSSHFSRSEAYPASLFDLSLTMYTKIRAYDMVKTLLERYRSTSKNAGPPLRFIAHLMTLHYRESAHHEVDRYWALSLQSATSRSKISTTYKNPAAPYLPPTRRTLLARHLDILLRSIDARDGTDHAQKMLDRINEYFNAGFDLDNLNWNLYIRLLATRGEILTAFTLCERHLMPSRSSSSSSSSISYHTFTSPTTITWQPDEPRAQYYQATGQKSPGMEYLGPRYTFLKAGELRVTYKTMVRFAWVIRGLRRKAPFEREKGEVLERLERDCPRTVGLVLGMPLLEHTAATHVLGKRSRRGFRRGFV